jgi:hypothetical protein
MRQMPTTGTSAFGSAPAVSPERSTLKTGAAIAGNSRTTLAAVISSAFVELYMMASSRNVRLERIPVRLTRLTSLPACA